MQLAMHNWTRPEPLDTTLDRLAQCGYDGIELACQPQQQDAREIAAMLKARGLACWGGVSAMTPGRDLAHADGAARAATVQYLKECVQLTAALGGQVFCTVPCTVGKLAPTAALEDEWRWVVAGLQELEAFCREQGVRLGVEPITRFETYFLNRTDQALRLADAVGGTCGVILDTFHMNIEDPDLVGAIRAAGTRLVDFHVADNNRFPPGQGALDWPPIIAALREVGYNGALTVEYVLPPDVTPLAAARRAEAIGFGDDQFLRDHGGGMLSDAHYTQLAQDSADFLRGLL